MDTSNDQNLMLLSDEEFLAMPEPSFPEEPVTEEPANAETGASGEEESTASEAEQAANSDEETGKDGQTSQESVDSTEQTSTEENSEEGEESDQSQEEDDGEETEEETSKEKASDTSTEDDTATKNAAVVEKLFGTFKAAGKDMKVNTVEEAISLMQQGADYNRKMAGIRPALKTLKMLENHSLLDEGKLAHLIDLSKGDKGAIRKLLQDHKIDSLDLDSEEGAEYRPNTYTVDDAQLDLDNVLADIRGDAHYSKTIEVIGNKWDEASRTALRAAPKNVAAIHVQMGNGIYDRIQAEMDRRDSLGVPREASSDFDRYMAVGNDLYTQGAFNDILTPSAPAPATETATVKPTPVGESAEDKAAKEEARRAKKRAASSSTRTQAANTKPIDYNPLLLSDEEFEKKFGHL